MSKHRAILIAGPTASGKSAVAQDVAERIGGVVVNADAMQVYGELRIVTARPEAADEARVPHRLYGHVSASEAYSAGRWAEDVALALEEARTTGLTPIITGGTGLYFKVLLEGLSPIPTVPEAVRAHWRAAAERLGAVELHALLATRDLLTASRLQPSDSQRITRALEVLEATGRPLAEWQQIPGTPIVEASGLIKFVLAPDRAVLAERIAKRFGAMLRDGACEEIGRLLALGLDPGLPAMRAVGVPPLAAHLRGEVSLDEARMQSIADTRQYLKRQLTWLRRHMAAWTWITDPVDARDAASEAVMAAIKS